MLLSSIRYVSYPMATIGSSSSTAGIRKGRPRSSEADRAILDAFRHELTERGFSDLRLEHVAARAGVGKATIYRRWHSKEALAVDLVLELASPLTPIAASGGTAEELAAIVSGEVRALTETRLGPVLRALLSQIALNPA